MFPISKLKKQKKLRKKIVAYTEKNAIYPLEIIRLENNSYHIAVSVEINGHKGEMLIDTGASITIIDEKFFPDLPSIECEGEIQSGSVNGSIESIRIVKIESFKIGNTDIGSCEVASTPMDYVNGLYQKHFNRSILGLLGSDFCVKHKARIDYEHMVFKLILPE